jgi:hypothetical protein
MEYVVYQTATLQVVRVYAYEKCALNRLSRLGDGYSVTDGATFVSLPVPMKTVKNLMTGEDVEIPVDTPWCCNPASETYWSM